MSSLVKTSSKSQIDHISDGTYYSQEFFARNADGSRRSASHIIPIVMKMLQPRSVVDVGCGIGTWLRVFSETGVKDICGIDGNYLKRDQLEIDHELFQSMDLARPTKLNRTFDLAVNLEVAEHLPLSSASRLVDFLTDLAPAVMFSAAIPGQGGTNHINEQWPWYWEELFLDRQFLQVDMIRPLIWQNDQVEWWYRQNIVLYIRKDRLHLFPDISEEPGMACKKGVPQMQFISEDILRGVVGASINNASPRQLLRQIPRAIWRSVRRRLWNP